MDSSLLLFIRLSPPRTGLTVVNQSVVDYFISKQIPVTVFNINKGKIPAIKYLLFNKFKKVYINLSSSKKGSFWDLLVLTTLSCRGSKVFSHIHNGDYLNNNLDLIQRVNLKLCNKVVVLSNTQYLYFLSKGISESKIEIVYNQKNWQREVHDTTKRDKKTVVYLSNFIEEKGYKKVVESFTRLSRINANLRMAGTFFSKKERNEFISQIENHGHIEYLGVLKSDDEIYELLSSADVFVLPTEYKKESFPMSIIEALLCGNVVVASKQGSIPEILDANCILLNDTSVETIHSGILEALNRVSPTTKQRIRENISNKLNRHSYEKLLEIIH